MTRLPLALAVSAACLVTACGSGASSSSTTSSSPASAAQGDGDFGTGTAATGTAVTIPGGTIHLTGTWRTASGSSAVKVLLDDSASPGANAQVTSVDAGAAGAAQLPVIVGQVKTSIQQAHSGADVADVAGSRVAGKPAQGFTFAYTDNGTPIKGEEIVVMAGSRALIIALGAPAATFDAEAAAFASMVDSITLS